MANVTSGGKNRDEGRPAGAGPGGTVQEAAANVTEKARGMASSATQTAGELASAAGQRAQEAASAVAGGMKNLAGTIRENMPREGFMGTASERVASSLESGSRYLQEEGFQGMADDLANLIRRNPLPAVLVGFGLGFLLARSLRS